MLAMECLEKAAWPHLLKEKGFEYGLMPCYSDDETQEIWTLFQVAALGPHEEVCIDQVVFMFMKGMDVLLDADILASGYFPEHTAMLINTGAPMFSNDGQGLSRVPGPSLDPSGSSGDAGGLAPTSLVTEPGALNVCGQPEVGGLTPEPPVIEVAGLSPRICEGLEDARIFATPDPLSRVGITGLDLAERVGAEGSQWRMGGLGIKHNLRKDGSYWVALTVRYVESKEWRLAPIDAHVTLAYLKSAEENIEKAVNSMRDALNQVIRRRGDMPTDLAFVGTLSPLGAQHYAWCDIHVHTPAHACLHRILSAGLAAIRGRVFGRPVLRVERSGEWKEVDLFTLR